MANTHGLPDVASELQATCQDLLPPCAFGGQPAVPGSGLVLAAFATSAYVIDGEQLVFVEQPAISVTLSGAAGAYWLAIHRDVSSAVAGWTRRAGSHYLWQTNATLPANPAGALVFAQVTVVGTNITAVAPVAVAYNPMSKQMASAVAITGGSIDVATGKIQNLALGIPVDTGFALNIAHNKAVNQYSIVLTAFGSDVSGSAMFFRNTSGSGVGSITYTGTATAYNTSSDARLKHATAALTGALDVVQALRPVAFRWRADDSPAVGFLAGEVQQVVDGVISGEPDAVDEEGRIIPQQIDPSKLVVWLVGACQTLAAQVEALTARLAALEDGLGV